MTLTRIDDWLRPAFFARAPKRRVNSYYEQLLHDATYPDADFSYSPVTGITSRPKVATDDLLDAEERSIYNSHLRPRQCQRGASE